jgi:hypothetical protein
MDEVVGKVEDVRESSCRASNSERDSDGNEGPAACESSSLFAFRACAVFLLSLHTPQYFSSISQHKSLVRLLLSLTETTIYFF